MTHREHISIEFSFELRLYSSSKSILRTSIEWK
jgi:hypothetical protein